MSDMQEHFKQVVRLFMCSPWPEGKTIRWEQGSDRETVRQEMDPEQLAWRVAEAERLRREYEELERSRRGEESE